VARLFLGESVMAAAADTAQVYGGYGFYPENHVERYYRDAKLDGIGGGTSEIQRLIISRALFESEASDPAPWLIPRELVHG
jgi:alkylation response protein AidB-like acyl-CoA dehydrogenase